MTFPSTESIAQEKTSMRASVKAKFVAVLIASALFSACSDDVVNNNPPTGQYTRTDNTTQLRNEVQLFVDNVYTPVLKAAPAGDPQRCGSCHNRTYGTPDIPPATLPFGDPSYSVSYDFATTQATASGQPYFDIVTPANSRVVQKVLENHHCYVNNNCQDTATAIQTAIENWAAALAGAGNLTADNGNDAPSLELIDELSIVTNLNDPQGIREVPAETDNSTLFNQILSDYTTVHNLVTQNCAGCHVSTSATPQQPYFAVADKKESMLTMLENQKIDLVQPDRSRIYVRLKTDQHNCWSNCANDATSMQSAIATFLSNIPVAAVAPGNNNSKAMTLEEGTRVNVGVRYDPPAYMVAKYLFNDAPDEGDRIGANRVITASSPDFGAGSSHLDLTLGTEVNWLSGWGVEFTGANSISNTVSSTAIAAESTRTAIFDSIRQFDEYSIEAWVVPGNVSQGTDDNPATIFSISRGSNIDMVLGQSEYKYIFKTRVNDVDPLVTPDYTATQQRTVGTDAQGQDITFEQRMTSGNDDVVQSTLQHVVVTYHHSEGRRIYVNGNIVADDATPPGALPTNWGAINNNVDYVTLGSLYDAAAEPTTYFSGKVRMLAMYNRSLPPEKVQQNFQAGVGQKFAVMFKIGQLDPSMHDQTYFLLTGEEFDDYSYKLFDPRIVVLEQDGTKALTGNISVSNIYIGINGKIPEAGQVFSRFSGTMDWQLEQRPLATVPDSMRSLTPLYTPTQYNFVTGTSGSGTSISPKATGTVVAKHADVSTDQFFIKFGDLNGQVDVISNGTAAPVIDPAYTADPATVDEDNALRNFDEIYASMLSLTGVSPSAATVDPDTSSISQLYFDVLRASLPTVADTATFVSAQQVAITRLSFEMCSAVITTNNDNLLGTDVSGSLTAANITSMATALATNYVGSYGAGSTPANTSDQTLVISELEGIANGLSAKSSKIRATAMCMAALANATAVLH